MTAPHPLAIDGELCIAEAAALRQTLLQALPAPAQALALDLSAVSACDSAGVQLLLALRRSLAEQGSALHLAKPAEPVRQALAVFGLDELLR